MEYVIQKLKNYNLGVVLKDNWKQVRKIVKWIVTAAVYSVFQEDPAVGALNALATKVILDFIDYLITPETSEDEKTKREREKDAKNL